MSFVIDVLTKALATVLAAGMLGLIAYVYSNPRRFLDHSRTGLRITCVFSVPLILGGGFFLMFYMIWRYAPADVMPIPLWVSLPVLAVLILFLGLVGAKDPQFFVSDREMLAATAGGIVALLFVLGAMYLASIPTYAASHDAALPREQAAAMQ